MTTNSVRYWRQKRRLTQEELARLAHIQQNYISAIETGARVGSVDTWRALAKALDVTVDTLLTPVQ
jgi:transcriptional regulator with XRE-family HTH domain